jgi:LCP family protein required for cell wall assembly
MAAHAVDRRCGPWYLGRGAQVGAGGPPAAVAAIRRAMEGACDLGGPPLPPRSQRRTRARRRIRWPRLAVVLAAAALAIGGPVAAWRGRSLGPLAADVVGGILARFAHQPGAPGGALRPQDPVTVLVMGTEKSPQFAGQQTDSMMLWSFDPRQKRAAVVSVPRDLWVDIPGHGYDRINDAFEFGGYRTAELAVERYMGVPVEYYAVVDYAALVKLVDDVGGVEVDVPHAIDDTCYPNAAENRCTTFRLSAGPHHLDGVTALKFARERHSLPESDFSRQADQQLLLFALRDALLQPRTLLHLPAVVGDMERLVTTDLPYAALPRLAQEVLRLPRASIAHAVLGYGTGAVRNYTTPGGAEVLLPDEQAIHRIVSRAFAPVLRYMGQATVQVENGAPTQQPLAGYLSGVLDGMGVRTLPALQAPRTDHTADEVYWNTAVAGGAARPPVLAHMLARMLGARVVARAVPSSRAQIVVVLGSAFPKVQP